MDSKPNHRLVLILYKALKSHLQYCLYVAMQILINDGGRLNYFHQLRGLYELTETSFRSFRFVPWEFPAMLIRFDIKGDWWRTPCSGNPPYENRLRRPFQSTPMALHAPCAQADRLLPKFPFACMRFDRFLFAPEPWSLNPSLASSTPARRSPAFPNHSLPKDAEGIGAPRG